MKTRLFSLVMFCGFISLSFAQRTTQTLKNHWKFINEDVQDAYKVEFDDSQWETVSIPHDWAIFGPFDRKHDLQEVTITQNMEKQASVKTGRTGGLPYVGIGWYRTTFEVPLGKEAQILFDGAMSEAKVYINGEKVCFWPWGYNSFHCNVTPYLNKVGKNTLAVRLENKPESSRWYPGAGLYRNVHLITTNKVHIPIWGTFITTPHISKDFAAIKIQTTINNTQNEELLIETQIVSPKGEVVSIQKNSRKIHHEQPFEQHFILNEPLLWSPENPNLYQAISTLYFKGEKVDSYTTPFGIRKIEFIANKGFYLNGEKRKFQGVCNHHDLGPLGAAINKSALRHQLNLLKDMGCDAIRTAHNMPAPELVELCDEMGFMMIIEAFDEWDIAKCKNGYHRFFNEWAEKDLINMIHNYRNNPSVILWSIGNEVPTQCNPEGYKVASFLQQICHREDPTRLVTCGMDQVSCVLDNGFAALLDVPGFNYRTHRYLEAYEKLPQQIVLGSETASTVSSRGVYKFPIEIKADATYPDHQSSSYDLEHCSWSNLPEEDFMLADDYDWTIGQFVWTGFDYLGEPSPYDTDAWPNHSSMFGIIDLASIPKDRYYLYRSIWNKKEPTLHILPHWNWEDKKGEVIPIFVYTNYPCAELFINGKSQGRQYKNNSTPQNRYRLMWKDIRYEPGELKVIAYDENGNPVYEKQLKTADKPHQIKLTSNTSNLQPNGEDLAYITVSVIDENGNLCSTDQREVQFRVKGSGKFRATANGDPTCLYIFHQPKMPAFNGMLTAIVQSSNQEGEIIIEASAKGVKKGVLKIPVRK